MNIALILAGGTGSRMNVDVPKQYLSVNGRTIISYCLQTFVDSDEIDMIWIVAEECWKQKILDIFKMDNLSTDKLKGFSNPGETRQLSIMNGLCDIGDFVDCSEAVVIIQDAARPMVTTAHISAYLQELDGYDGVMPVLPMKDTVYLSEDGKSITGLLNRSQIFAGQAPEVFVYNKYYEACLKLMPEEIKAINGSSEPAVCAGMNIHMIPGDERNFKITTIQDLERFKRELE